MHRRRVLQALSLAGLACTTRSLAPARKCVHRGDAVEWLGTAGEPLRVDDLVIPADLDEAWLFRGAVLDVDPRRVDVGFIDAHTHPYRRTAAGELEPDTTALLEVEQRQGITRALTMVRGTFAEQRAVVGALCHAHPWLVPIAFVQAEHDDVEGAAALLREGFRGLKFHPARSGSDADGPHMNPFMELARRARVPVQVHCATDAHSTPERLAALARRFPDVPVVMVHTELGALDKHHALDLVQGLPNVYAETSWTNPEGVLLAMARLGPRRTLFGTDATVDDRAQFEKASIADAQGQYTWSIPRVMAEVRARASPEAFTDWAWLSVVRLYGLRLKSP
jgi:hypothetical protein